MKIFGYLLIGVVLGWAVYLQRIKESDRIKFEAYQAEQKRKSAETDALNKKTQQEYTPKNTACKQAILKSINNPHTVSMISEPHAGPGLDFQLYSKTESEFETGYFEFMADAGDGFRKHAVHCYLDHLGRVVDLRVAPPG